jgi:ribA/ribD-fused uncharacterized protein
MPIMQFHSKSKKTEPPFTPTAMKDLSNFSDHDVSYGGNIYKTVEHAFQAIKYSCTNKPELVETIRLAFADKTSTEAKSSGGKAAMKKWKVELDVSCWENKKVEVMRALIASKMERHPEIRQIIKVAKENNVILVHFSRTDMYWGAHVNEAGTGVKAGENILGKIFMSYYDTANRSTSSSTTVVPPAPIQAVKVKTQKVKEKKECEPDQIRNPDTDRCVSRTSKLGKSILAKQVVGSPAVSLHNQTQKKASPKRKDCDSDQIRNPDTGRCVSRTSKLGKSILAKTVAISPSVASSLSPASPMPVMPMPMQPKITSPVKQGSPVSPMPRPATPFAFSSPHASPVMPMPRPPTPHASPVMPMPRPPTPHASPVMPMPRPATPHASPVMPTPRPATPHASPVKQASPDSWDEWDVEDLWDNPKFNPYLDPTYIPAPPPRRVRPTVPVVKTLKKKKRLPLTKFEVYQRFNKMNKDKFALGSNATKRELLERHQVNPRNTDSSSYVVEGIEPNMLSYYNMLSDKNKNYVLKRQVEDRMKFLNFIYALEHNNKK